MSPLAKDPEQGRGLIDLTRANSQGRLRGRNFWRMDRILIDDQERPESHKSYNICASQHESWLKDTDIKRGAQSNYQFSSVQFIRSVVSLRPHVLQLYPNKKRKMGSPPQWNPCDLLLSPMWCQFRQLMKMIDVDLHMISKYFAYFHSHWNARTDSSVPRFLPSFI